MHELKGKRIYEPYEKTDGYRILIDRLWPRGIKKENAHLDAWVKEIAPSNELRKKFHADHDFDQFRQSYENELTVNPAAHKLIDDIKDHLSEENVTLLTASRDIEHCNLPVLLEYIRKNADVS